MATFLKISEKAGRIDHPPFNIYHMVQRLWKSVQRILRYFGSEWTSPVQNQNSLPWQRPLRNRKNWTCSLGTEVSLHLLDWFSQSLQLVVGIELQMINPIFFFRYLKGQCHGNQLKLKNLCFLRTDLLCRTAIRKGIAISQFRFWKVQQNEFLYILYNFGDIRSSYLRDYAVNNCTLCGDTAKSGISRQISQNILDLPWPTLQVW